MKRSRDDEGPGMGGKRQAGGALGGSLIGPTLERTNLSSSQTPSESGARAAQQTPDLTPPTTHMPVACRRDYQEETRRERLTTMDALSYLREVKTRFASNRKVYDR